jgi:hypothetical protein
VLGLPPLPDPHCPVGGVVGRGGALGDPIVDRVSVGDQEQGVEAADARVL